MYFARKILSAWSTSQNLGKKYTIDFFRFGSELGRSWSSKVILAHPIGQSGTKFLLKSFENCFSDPRKILNWFSQTRIPVSFFCIWLWFSTVNLESQKGPKLPDYIIFPDKDCCQRFLYRVVIRFREFLFSNSK